MTDSAHRTYCVGLCGNQVNITYNNLEAKEFLDFLFKDLVPAQSYPVCQQYALLMVGKPVKMSLWKGEKQLYFGESKHALAYVLVNEVIYEIINNNQVDLAFHAAFVSRGNRGVLFPGLSGAGKSSLAAWLTAQGYTYHTDELVFIARDGQMFPFTRPISLRADSFSALSVYIDFQHDDILSGKEGVIVSHRSLNSCWAPLSPSVDLIVHPEFTTKRQAALTKLSSGQSCMKLFKSYVNARNISGHGFKDIADIARKATSYDLTFGGFNDIRTTLEPLLDETFSDTP